MSESHTFTGSRVDFSLGATPTGIRVIGAATDVVVPYGDVMVFDDMSRTAKNTIDMIHHVTSHFEGYTAWETQADLPVSFLRSSAYWDSTWSVFPDRADKVVVSYINAAEFSGLGGWDYSFDKTWDKDGDNKIDSDVENLPDYVDVAVYNEDWHNYRAKYWTSAWRDELAKKIDHVASQGFDGVMMDLMTGWNGWVGKTSNSDAWLKEQMAELFRWISDYAKEKYGSSFVITTNLDLDASSYFPDMGKYIDAGYYQNAFWWWNGNGENYPDGAGSRGKPLEFLLQQGIQPLYMDHIGTGPRDQFTWFEDFDAKATTEKYLETFGYAIDKSALPYISPVLFGTPYAMAPRYARVDAAGLHAGTAYRDWVIGSSGNDRINGGDGDDLLAGLGGNDRLNGGAGVDTAYFARSTKGVVISLSGGTATGDGRDTLVGIENVIGSNFADNIVGSRANNRIEGGAGNDKLDGGVGADKMFGGAGNDTYYVESVGDRVYETATAAASDTTDLGGTDTVASSIDYKLGRFLENLTLTGTANLAGTGNNLGNALLGNSGANILKGLVGDDTLKGGAGNDTLLGGAGKDTLSGGAGKDAFVFDTSPASRDTITDFNRTDGDKIQLSKAVFTGFAYTGALHAEDFYAAAGATKAQDATDRVIYNTTTGVLYYDADGLGGTAAVQIALLGASTHPALVYGDLQIFA